MTLTQETVIRRFVRYHPADADQAIRRCRVPLQYMRSGSFRHVFHIIGLPLVVKFPYCEDEYSGSDCPERIAMGVKHSNAEMRSLQRILNSTRKYAHLHHFMPTVYYSNKRTGVIVMRKYTELPNSLKSDRISNRIDSIIRGTLEVAADISWPNLGRDEKGNVVIFDLGCFAKDYQ